MKMNRSLLITALLILVTSALSAEEPAYGGFSAEEAPWLKGVEISPIPKDISPVIPLKIYAENGEAVPATLTEDIPVTLLCESTIFDPEPPAEYKGQEIPNPRWETNPSPSWYFIDWEKNKNFMASTTHQVALNQMIVTPLMPTGKGAITCYIGRRMRYDLPEPGRTKVTYANSSGAKGVRVLDITPPTCGLEVSVKNGKSGIFWSVENPPNKYPLPKLADVYLSGGLVNQDPDEVLAVQALELGANMIVTPDQAAIHVNADSEINIKVVGGDNYKLDNAKLKYGICNGAGGEPAPVGPVNASEIKLSDINLPDEPYFYVDASDEAGNRQVIFVPLKVE
ncbi:MAG: hypothetical protein PWR01_3471 [Clostridiales bacterium]|jgi:hypothetical protein|nr:hypothetical protein [Clostridiales bacterium]MDN5282398.1 hypothetical protein [Candidatus Ozemobacter sp.]